MKVRLLPCRSDRHHALTLLVPDFRAGVFLHWSGKERHLTERHGIGVQILVCNVGNRSYRPRVMWLSSSSIERPSVIQRCAFACSPK